MNRLGIKTFITPLLATGAVLLLGATVALAQTTDQAKRTDGQIEADVVHALDASAQLNNDLITAATIQGEVTLSGTVSTQASKELSASIVQAVPGVSKVHNNLSIGDPQQAAKEQNMIPDDNVVDEQPSPTAQNQPLPGAQTSAAQPQSAPYTNSQRPHYGIPDADPSQTAQQYPAAPPQYPAQQYPQQPAYQPASGPVTIAPGTLIELRTDEAITSKRAQNGSPIEFTVIKDVLAGGVVAIPRGATMHGVIAEVSQVGRGDFGGTSKLAIQLTSLDLGGRRYPVESDMFRIQGPNKAGSTAGNAIAGGLIGTIIGCAIGRGPGCAIGAGAGVAAGAAASAASNGPQAWIPAEARVDFHLAEPLTVAPVDAQEASRLAQGLYQGGPSLYQRPQQQPSPYYGRSYPGYGYPYSPVYFRPYIMVGGGMHYWR